MKETILNEPDAEHRLEKRNIETINVGTIVSSVAHPYTSTNTNVLITTYAHFIPPLMVVVEKNYGVSYNALSGEKEENTSCKCLYYSTLNGTFEFNWFKIREIKAVRKEDENIAVANENKTLEELKKEFLGKTVSLASVDLELDKIKIWSDNTTEFTRMKTNNLLDFLPPLSSIIDVKFNDDYRKYNEKNGQIIHLKSKIIVKVRWLNNHTSKYSEEYIPLLALKMIEIQLKEFSLQDLYAQVSKLELESDLTLHIQATPLKFLDIIWKHYYYIYRFKNLFNNQIISFKENSLHKVNKIMIESYEEGKLIFNAPNFNYVNILSFFKIENKSYFENKWCEIEYLDKGERYSKRIIYIKELIVEDIPFESLKKRVLLKANCLLREGKIRHFYVDRISSFRIMPANFETIFVKK